MANPWIVEPEEVRSELKWVDSAGELREFWIAFKKHLNVGEARRMLGSVSQFSQDMPKTGKERPDAKAVFEWTDYSFARCLMYLTDWSLRGENDNKMPITRESLEQLHADLFELIDNTIDAHETRVSEEKKAAGGKRKSGPTSPS